MGLSLIHISRALFVFHEWELDAAYTEAAGSGAVLTERARFGEYVPVSYTHLYEFFKSQGAAIVNDASDFAGTNGCYLYQGRDVKEDKEMCIRDRGCQC